MEDGAADGVADLAVDSPEWDGAADSLGWDGAGDVDEKKIQMKNEFLNSVEKTIF
jgi:hypothetical protein